MTPTVHMALLTHPRQASTVGLPEDAGRHAGRPLHLSLHTRRADADEALWLALVQQWNTEHAYGRGRADSYAALHLRRLMADEGYTATVSEVEVEL